MTSTENARDIRITRLYDAPVAVVWDAWTDLAQVAQWWGPRGFTITTHSKELRPGGTWVYTMHGPDGVDYPNYTRYHVVEPQARLVYDHGANAADAAPMFQVTVLFHARGERAELEITMTFPSAEIARDARVFIKAAGGNSTWDRLAEYVEKQQSGDDIFVINRSFPAPIETMWEMFTSPTHFAAWLPPTGFTMEFKRVNIVPGGDGFYAMTNGQFTMYGRVEYQRIERPHAIEYTQCFTDADEHISRHPGAPTWPEKMRTAVTLTSEGVQTTRVTIRWSVDGTATREEIAAFVAERGGMTKGWTGSFDKLEDYLGATDSTLATPV